MTPALFRRQGAVKEKDAVGDSPFPCIEVLLPTYNGESFLPELLRSLLGQEGVQVVLSVRDDNSSDATPEIVRLFAAKHGNMRYTIGPRLGVVGNVNALLESGEPYAPYFALADQDDVWYLEKLRILHAAMRKMEETYGEDVPLLVCSDARCVDACGTVLAPSFLGQLGIPHGWGRDIREALVMSHALGCSCMGNAALRRWAAPLPAAEHIFMHDWWLLLVAACFGAVHCIRTPLLDYRQHTKNVLGAKGKGSFRERLAQADTNARRTQQQAATFLHRFEKQLPAGQRQAIAAWADMPTGPRPLRLWHCWRQGFGKPGWRWVLT